MPAGQRRGNGTVFGGGGGLCPRSSLGGTRCRGAEWGAMGEPFCHEPFMLQNEGERPWGHMAARLPPPPQAVPGPRQCGEPRRGGGVPRIRRPSQREGFAGWWLARRRFSFPGGERNVLNLDVRPPRDAGLVSERSPPPGRCWRHHPPCVGTCCRRGTCVLAWGSLPASEPLHLAPGFRLGDVTAEQA